MKTTRNKDIDFNKINDLKKGKTIICVPGATPSECAKISKALEIDRNIVINMNVRLFKIKDNEVFEVVESLKKANT